MDKKKICAGIVTYNPDISLLEKVVYAAASQVDKVFVFDNNSANINALENSSFANLINIIAADENKGIAYALNRLCEIAVNNRYSWMLTLDHDTIISDGLINSFKTFVGDNTIGIICPRVNYVGVSIPDRFDSSKRCVEVPACMTSGSLMSLNAWGKTEKFNEWLFIDSVDNDICYQLRSKGFKIIRDNNVFMEHNLGYPKERRVFFVKFTDFCYSPIRLYYINRNRIYLTKKYWRSEGIRFVLASYKIILSNLFLYMFDKDRRKMICKGIRDGLFS